jgi:hypothetical protein
MHGGPVFQPSYVQAFAGRKRAAFWRKLAFPNLVRARARKEQLRWERRREYTDEELTEFMADLTPMVGEPSA